MKVCPFFIDNKNIMVKFIKIINFTHLFISVNIWILILKEGEKMLEMINEAYILLCPERKIVGVKLVTSKEEFEAFEARELVAPMSYCVAVKSATLGHSVKLTAQNSGCMGSTRALGLVGPNKGFYNGEEGCRLGLYDNKKIAAEVAAKMKLCPEETYGVIVKPIEYFEKEPDVVLVIADSRTIMRVIQGYTYFYGMQEQFCMTGNQAVCVEGTAVPYMTGKINVSMFCSGTRYLARWKDTELVVGIPYGQV